jgi:hypothetical protein
MCTTYLDKLPLEGSYTLAPSRNNQGYAPTYCSAAGVHFCLLFMVEAAAVAAGCMLIYPSQG